MRKLNNFETLKNSKVGNNAVIVSYVTALSFSKNNIFNWQITQYRNFLINYLGYDNVYILANTNVRKINEAIFSKDIVITDFNKENILLDYKIDDVYSVSLFYTFFGGLCSCAYYSVICRVYELLNNKIGHYYHIQDDPETCSINPVEYFDLRTSDVKMKYDVDKEKYFSIKHNVEKIFDNTIIAYCGTDYEHYYNFMLNKNSKCAQYRLPKCIYGWMHYSIYDYMCVNSYIDNKLKDYSDNKKFISEYHGYIKKDPKRVKTTVSFYNNLVGDKVIISGKKTFSDKLEYTDRVINLSYNDMLDYIAQNTYSTFVTHSECCWNDFISPRYIDAMLIDNICFVYDKYDEFHKITDNKELIDFMFVKTPEEFKTKVNMIINDKYLYNRIKYLQRLSIYNKYKNQMTEESINKFKKYFNNYDKQ